METYFLTLSFHNNKVFLTLDHCSLTLISFILTLENFGPRVNDSWDSDLSENPDCMRAFVNYFLKKLLLRYFDWIFTKFHRNVP